MSLYDGFTGPGGRKPEGDIRALIARRQDDTANALADVRARIAEAEALHAQLPPADPPAPPCVDDVFASTGPELAAIDTAHALAECALQGFAARHGLAETAVVPDARITGLILGLLVFGEGALNGCFFLSAQMSATPLAALLTSMLIAGTNIALSAAAGFWLGRNLPYGANAIDADSPGFIRRRQTARAGLAVFGGVAALFHVTVGLVRSQEELGVVEHSLSAYQAIVTTPESLFLVMMGSVMTILAFHKGKHGFDDPYPGYGQHRRAVERWLDARHALFDDAAAGIDRRFDAAQRASAKRTQAAARRYQDYNRAVKACHAAYRAYRQQIASAEGALKAEVANMLALYAVGRDVTGALGADELNRMVCLQDATALDLPAYAHPPDTGAREETFVRAKAEALKATEKTEAPRRETVGPGSTMVRLHKPFPDLRPRSEQGPLRAAFNRAWLREQRAARMAQYEAERTAMARNQPDNSQEMRPNVAKEWTR